MCSTCGKHTTKKKEGKKKTKKKKQISSILDSTAFLNTQSEYYKLKGFIQPSEYIIRGICKWHMIRDMKGRCTPQSALTVVKKQKFLSSPTGTDPSIAGNAIRNTGQKEIDTENSLYTTF